MIAVIAGVLGVLLLLWIVGTLFSRRGGGGKTCTVLVCGATGVGKSTLINTIAKREAAQVGAGDPVTQNTTRVEIPALNLALYDSKGLEVIDASQTYLILLSDLLRLRFQRNHLHQIDLVLICILEQSTRFDEAHTEIAALCDDLHIPYGIALTQQVGNAAFRRAVNTAFPRAKFVHAVRALPLIARIKIPASGVNELVDLLRRHQSWNAGQAVARCSRADATQALSDAARELASAPSDMAWERFARSAYEQMLTPGESGPPYYGGIVAPMRDNIRKKLVPGFWDRLIFKVIDNDKIDAAIARRLVPCIIRAFTRGEHALSAGALTTAETEATQTLREDRPYRSRF